jgi:hypothetical protein
LEGHRPPHKHWPLQGHRPPEGHRPLISIGLRKGISPKGLNLLLKKDWATYHVCRLCCFHYLRNNRTLIGTNGYVVVEDMKVQVSFTLKYSLSNHPVLFVKLFFRLLVRHVEHVQKVHPPPPATDSIEHRLLRLKGLTFNYEGCPLSKPLIDAVSGYRCAGVYIY